MDDLRRPCFYLRMLYNSNFSTKIMLSGSSDAVSERTLYFDFCAPLNRATAEANARLLEGWIPSLKIIIEWKSGANAASGMHFARIEARDVPEDARCSSQDELLHFLNLGE